MNSDRVYCRNLFGPKRRQPFTEWFRALRVIRTQARVENRLRRLNLGLLGDHRAVGSGVYELRFDFGPGYRIYFARSGNTITLLCGGSKNTQKRDIERAQGYLRNYKERTE